MIAAHLRHGPITAACITAFHGTCVDCMHYRKWLNMPSRSPPDELLTLHLASDHGPSSTSCFFCSLVRSVSPVVPAAKEPGFLRLAASTCRRAAANVHPCHHPSSSQPVVANLTVCVLPTNCNPPSFAIPRATLIIKSPVAQSISCLVSYHLVSPPYNCRFQHASLPNIGQANAREAFLQPGKQHPMLRLLLLKRRQKSSTGQPIP